jgi:HPt (histidine-containing phosphotransfer) domain-containing protein
VRTSGGEDGRRVNDFVSPVTLDRAALAELRELIGGDPAFLAEMIDTFLDDGSKLMAEIETARATGDAVALRRAAHTLKSNCRNFGASALADLCQEIEERAATRNLDGVASLTARAVAEYLVVVAALRAERPDA